MKGGLMILALVLLLLSQLGGQTVVFDNAAVPQPTERLLVTHVVYFNGSGTEEDRKSVKRALDCEVLKDEASYQRSGVSVFTERQVGKIAMVARLWQVDHFEIQPLPIRPRE